MADKKPSSRQAKAKSRKEEVGERDGLAGSIDASPEEIARSLFRPRPASNKGSETKNSLKRSKSS